MWLNHRVKLVAEPIRAATVAACLASDVDKLPTEVGINTGGNMVLDRILDIMTRHG